MTTIKVTLIALKFPHFGSHNKQPLFVYTTLIDWFFTTYMQCVYCAVRTGSLNIFQVMLISTC